MGSSSLVTERGTSRTVSWWSPSMSFILGCKSEGRCQGVSVLLWLGSRVGLQLKLSGCPARKNRLAVR